MKIIELLKLGTEKLAKNSLSARLDAELLLSYILGVARSYLFAWPEQELSERQADHYFGLVTKREQGTPIAYIIHHCEFWSLDLMVTETTLIPRPETELLVELALIHIPQHQIVSVADLGTGSGAVALALANERPHARINAVDVSAEALTIARENAKRLRIDNIRFYLGQWCAPLTTNHFDIIVANPPYIAADDPHLQQGNLRFEPRSALVADEQGLAAIKIIIKQAKDYLCLGGYCMLEHGFGQAEQVRKLFIGAGYQDVRSYRDLQSIERVTGGKWG